MSKFSGCLTLVSSNLLYHTILLIWFLWATSNLSKSLCNLVSVDLYVNSCLDAISVQIFFISVTCTRVICVFELAKPYIWLLVLSQMLNMKSDSFKSIYWLFRKNFKWFSNANYWILVLSLSSWHSRLRKTTSNIYLFSCNLDSYIKSGHFGQKNEISAYNLLSINQISQTWY